MGVACQGLAVVQDVTTMGRWGFDVDHGSIAGEGKRAVYIQLCAACVRRATWLFVVALA